MFPFQTCGWSDRDTVCPDPGQSTERAEQLCDADQHIQGTVSTHFSPLSNFCPSSHLFLSSLHCIKYIVFINRQGKFITTNHEVYNTILCSWLL